MNCRKPRARICEEEMMEMAMLAYSRAEFCRRHQRPLAALAALGGNNGRD